jgi:hypothetical protein
MLIYGISCFVMSVLMPCNWRLWEAWRVLQERERQITYTCLSWNFTIVLNVADIHTFTVLSLSF